MTSPTSPTKKFTSTTGGRPPSAVKFARRTSSGRVVSLSRDDDLELSSDYGSQTDFSNYTVLMPPTPDNQPSGPSTSNDQSKPDGPSLYGTIGISRRVGGEEDDGGGGGNKGGAKMDRRVSVMKTNKSMLLRTQTGDFDHNRWLFESKKNEDAYGPDGIEMSMSDFIDKPWKPLTRKISIPPAILSPYRYKSNRDAMWLWGLSVVCEIWFAFSWILDQLPKLSPVNRATDLAALADKFEQPSPTNPEGRSDLPGIDVFVSTADPDKRTSASVEYPVEKLSCYISDDGGAILTFEAMAEAVSFAEVWIPFCRKHNIEPRNPDSYFSIKGDPTKNKKRPDFVKDRRWIKREYDEFKVRINGLPDVIKKRSKKLAKEKKWGNLPSEPIQVQKATWMADGTHWPGTWFTSAPDHAKSDHAGIIQVMSKVPDNDPVYGNAEDKFLDFTGIDVRIPMFAYVSREKRKGYDHNKKAGAMNAMVRASAILSNGPFILNLDCDHYFYNCMALREGMIDPSDRYANHNTVFFDGNMRALDGIQGPVYVGTGCMFRRFALYGFHPPRANEYSGIFGQNKTPAPHFRFGNSTMFTDSIAVAEFQGRPLADHPSIKNGRPPGALLAPRPPLDAPTCAEAVAVISCCQSTTKIPTTCCISKCWHLSIHFNLSCHILLLTSVVSLFRSLHRETLDVTFLFYLLTITLCLALLSLLEVKWSGIALEEWWRNEQFWVIGGSSAHLAAVIQGLLKVIAGIEISFTLTAKSSAEDEDDIYADLYVVKWTGLFLVPLTILIVNLIALVIGISRTIYSVIPQWNKLLGGAFFSFWVLAHMYPFAKGLMGRKGKLSTIIYVWSGVIAITVSLLWITISPPDDGVGSVVKWYH
ncbi:hypothetical protein MKW92_013261 [Papaver armeniacum]|nr:hypothetical protein MKW92_013261 [Papaver armeniacum]